MADSMFGIDAMGGGAGSIEEAHHHLNAIDPEITAVHLGFTLITIFVIVFGIGSAFIKERLYAGEAIIATMIGIAFGPYGADLFNPRAWGGGEDYDDVLLEVTRVVIALSVFAVGVELPRAYVLKHWRSLAILLGPTMLGGWMISGALMYGLIPGITFLEALVIAAGVTPTDPILAASVVGKGKFAADHVPSHIRHILQAESGCNDGAAFPFLYLALFLVLRNGDSVGTAVGRWFYLVVLYQILLGTIIGVFIGIAARKLMKFAKRRALIDRESMVAMYVALALFSASVTTLAGSDDLLAAFACGAAFAWDDWFTDSIEESNFSSIIDLLVNSATFFFVGATIPFASFNSDVLTLTWWRLLILGISILLIRRLPIVYLLHSFMPDIHTRREALFCGWFGPMGIGALFISTLAAEKLPTPRLPPEDSLDILALTIQPVTYFIVLCSIISHGLSIPFFTLSKRVHSRVHSISRTWTQGSNADGPSWMTRVRRVGDPKDIEINRDEEKAELGEAEKRPSEKQGVDLGTDVDVRDFADGHGGSRSGSGSSKDIKSDEAPSSDKTAVEGDEGEDGRREKHFRDKDDGDDDTEVFQEGSDTIIDRHHGEDVERIQADGTEDRHRTHLPHFHAPHFGHKEDKGKATTGSAPATATGNANATTTGNDNATTTPPKNDAERDDRARAAELSLELGRIARGASTSSVRPRLADRLRTFSIGSPYDPSRDEEYRHERHDCRTTPARGKPKTEEEPKRWREGRRVVIERKGGEEVEVVEEDPDEDATKAAIAHPQRQVLRLPSFLGRAPAKKPGDPLGVKPGLPSASTRKGRPDPSAIQVPSTVEEGAESPPLTADQPPNMLQNALAKVSSIASTASQKSTTKPSDVEAQAAAPTTSTSTTPASPRQEGAGLNLRRMLHVRHADQQDVEANGAERGRGAERAPGTSSRNPSPSRSLRFDLPTGHRPSEEDTAPSRAKSAGLRLTRH